MSEAIARLSKDLAKAARELGPREVRFLVDEYYTMQKQRIRGHNQVRAMTDDSREPHELLRWYAEQSASLENQIKRALGKYVESNDIGVWMTAQHGIGPVIAAGLLAHIDITKAPTVGHIWRFAGLDSKVIWPSAAAAKEWLESRGLRGKLKEPVGETIRLAADHFGRRTDTLTRFASDDGKHDITVSRLATALARKPFNGKLKTLCWKIGESFVKFKGSESCFYGKLFEQRKAQEVAKNQRKEFADQAEATLRKHPTHAQKDVYEEGMLPDGRIHLRAQRYAVKIFLSHLHGIWYEHHFKEKPPKPFVIEHLGHTDYIPPPPGGIFS